MHNEVPKLTLRRYRQLLRLFRRLPGKEAEEGLSQLRADMKKNISASASESEALIEKMENKIRYLKMVTPKQPGDWSNLDGVTYYVVRGGRVVQGKASKENRVADGVISMSEAQSLHQKLLQRQHFGRTPPKYDPNKF